MADPPPSRSENVYAGYVGTMEEAAALLALLRDRKSGWGTIADRVEETGSALKVLAERVPSQALLFDDTDSAGEDDPLPAAQEAIRRWRDEGLQLVTMLEPAYPQQLLTIHQRPPFLFYRGTLRLEDSVSVAVVGTRHPTDAGKRRAKEIAAGLATQGVTVVSGLAAGIDTAAHLAALAEGGRTVAVIGTGLRKSYPAANKDLQEQIGREHLVLSQFWPDSPPTKTSFPMRNAVMSGYAAATVVIEAAWKSGARMQARLALEHGRPVFLHETLLEHDWAHEYVGRGAVVVSSSADVLHQLNQRVRPVDELV